jgi:hypothetical protein
MVEILLNLEALTQVLEVEDMHKEETLADLVVQELLLLDTLTLSH